MLGAGPGLELHRTSLPDLADTAHFDGALPYPRRGITQRREPIDSRSLVASGT